MTREIQLQAALFTQLPDGCLGWRLPRLKTASRKLDARVLSKNMIKHQEFRAAHDEANSFFSEPVVHCPITGS